MKNSLTELIIKFLNCDLCSQYSHFIPLHLHSVDSVFSATSVFQTDKDCRLWDARTELNKLQREAIECGVKHSFQLIQGPPGID